MRWALAAVVLWACSERGSGHATPPDSGSSGAPTGGGSSGVGGLGGASAGAGGVLGGADAGQDAELDAGAAGAAGAQAPDAGTDAAEASTGGAGGSGGAPTGGAGGVLPALGDDCGKPLEIDQLVASPPHWTSATVPIAGLTNAYPPSNPKPGSSACWASGWPDLVAHFKANGPPSICATRSVSCSLNTPWQSAMSVAKFKCPPSEVAYTACCPGSGPCAQQVVSLCGGEDVFSAIWLAPGAPSGASVQCSVY